MNNLFNKLYYALLIVYGEDAALSIFDELLHYISLCFFNNDSTC